MMKPHSIFAAILSFVLTFMPVAGTAQTEASRLQVTGHGLVSAVPDMAVIRLGVREEAKDAVSASRAVGEGITRLLGDLKEIGIEGKDIQTSQLSLSPQYNYSGSSNPRRIGFEASSTLSVTLRELEDLGGVLDQVIRSGVNNINGLQFDLSNRETLRDEARALAVSDAMRKAGLLAEAAGLSLGQVILLQEGADAPQPGPVFGRMAMEVQAEMPVAQGELDVTAQVTMIFELSGES
ncbi:SIMPL domain-containing protein [Aliiroseovarius sp. KMU-50]|uniref:SIMPL domain-containing protein n=1 Tax=Aliiroseovarius salicola TaxID=3009082 RepID=A0ABT4W211_9RHOB|nr:SIMPL domain-containing protein [Aliiroseovarius sp. KMU-50]MDA5094553.1 SIMPL domain-containing protein [Aliiroseovarius sp. KMU-50]